MELPEYTYSYVIVVNGDVMWTERE